MSVVDEPNTAVFSNGVEIPQDNLKLAETSGTFRKACRVLGGTPIPLVHPVLTHAMDCLSGMSKMSSLNNYSMFMLFFVALFLDTEILINYIVFNLINRYNCVDILALLSKFKKRTDFLTKSVLNYFIADLKLDPEYVLLSMTRDPRKLRWEISRMNIRLNDNRSLDCVPSLCSVCKILILNNEDLSLIKKRVLTTCCGAALHINCYKKVMALLQGICPYCKCKYVSGVLLPKSELSSTPRVASINPYNV